MASVRLTLKTNFKEASKDMKQGGVVLEESAKNYAKVVKELNTSAIDKFIVKVTRMGAAVKATKGPYAALISQQRMLTGHIIGHVKDGLDPMDERLRTVRERLIDVGVQIEKYKEQQKAAKEAARLAVEQEKRLNAELERKKRILKTVTDAAVRYAKYGLMAMATAAVVMTGAMLKSSAGIEDAVAAFRPMLGSLEKAEHLVDLINETAATTPFQFEAISDSAKQLLPAVNGSMKGVIATFRMLGDVSSGNAQRLDSITRAYTKSMLRGRVDMRSLNMIAKAGVPIYSQLAKSMGVTIDKLFDMSRRGKIASTDLTAAFQQMTSEGGMFFRGMEIASKTLTGRISTLKDNLMLLSANLGNVLLPYAKQFVEYSLDFVQMLRTITQGGKGASAVLELIAAGFLNMAVALGTFIVAAKGAWIVETLTIAIHGLTAAVAANPLGLIVVGVTALITALVYLVRNWDFTINRLKYGANFIAEYILGKVEEIRYSWNVLPTAMELAWGKFSRYFIDSLFTMKHEFLKFMRATSKFQSTKEWYDNLLGQNARHRVASKKLWNKKVQDLQNSFNEQENLFKTKTEALGIAAKKLRERLNKELSGQKAPGSGPADVEMPMATTTFERYLDATATLEKEKELQFQAESINTLKAHLEKRLELYRLKGNERIEWLKKEKDRILALEGGFKEERAFVVQAVEDMITELTKKATEKRIKEQETKLKGFFSWLKKTYDEVAQWQEKQRKEEKKKVTDFFTWLKKTYDEVNKFVAEEEKKKNDAWNELLKQNKKAWDEYGKKVVTNLTKVTNAGMQRLRIFVSATTNFIVKAAETGELAFKNMLKSIALQLVQFQATKAMTGLFTGLLAGKEQQMTLGDQTNIANTLGGALLGPLFGGSIAKSKSKNGNIFMKPGVTSVSETGKPEAVMPLVRRNGVLGVAAPAGGGGGDLIVQVNNNSQAEVGVQESTDGNGRRMLQIMIDGGVKNFFNSGRSDTMMRTNYGVRRRPGR